MTKFEEPSFYIIEVDKEKNRLKILFFGHWKSPDDVPKYLEHVEKSTIMLTPGYSILAKIEDKNPPKLSVTSLHKKGQQLMKKAGVSKTAVIVGKGRTLQKMSLNVVGRLSGMALKVFDDEEKALLWLK